MLHRCLLRQLRPPILSPSHNGKVADKQYISQRFVHVRVYHSPSATPTISPGVLVSNLTNFTAAGEQSWIFSFAPCSYSKFLHPALSQPSPDLVFFSLPTPQPALSQSLRAPDAVLKTHPQDLQGVYSFLLKRRFVGNDVSLCTVQRQGISHIIKEWTEAAEAETSFQHVAIWEREFLVAVENSKTRGTQKAKYKIPWQSVYASKCRWLFRSPF